MTVLNATAASSDFVGDWHAFDALGPRQLYDLLRLRQDVFVVEQACAYSDIDGRDPDALHYLMLNGSTGQIAGALRIFLPQTATGTPSGTSYGAPPEAGEGEASRIGRVVIAQDCRGLGLGRSLMEAGIAKCLEAAPEVPIQLSAQAYLEAFYESLGFKRASDNYLEDGLWHLAMIRPV